MSGLPAVVTILFGVAMLASLVIVVVNMRRALRHQDTSREPASQTARTALPYVLGFVGLLAILLGVYWLSR